LFVRAITLCASFSALSVSSIALAKSRIRRWQMPPADIFYIVKRGST